MGRTVDLEGTPQHDTEAAILIDFGDPSGEYTWVPKSLIEDIEVEPDGSSVYTIPEWFAQKEGLV